MQIAYPDKVRTIIEKLQDAGYEAFAVGGCVRDSILGIKPHDWDITTSARPEEVKELFHRTIDTGIKHGTVTVMMGSEGFEITTYRIDGVYEDSRHPKEVTFTSSLEEDLRRRDFTINAMAYSNRDGLIDLFGGRSDLNEGIIRCVGNARERFSEDALRMLRALRFSARFGYEIDSETEEAIKELAPTLSNISAERIRDELEKITCSAHPDRLRRAYELGVTAVVFPEWDEMMRCDQVTPHHFTDVGDHTIAVIDYIAKKQWDDPGADNRILRLAALLHDIGKPVMKTTGDDGIDHFRGHPEAGVKLAEDLMRRLKYDNDTIDRVSTLVRYHDDTPALTHPGVRRFIIKVGMDNMDDLIRLKYADLYGHTDHLFDEKLGKIKALEEIYGAIRGSEDCMSVKDLAVNGHDIINMGVRSGPLVGEHLERLLACVLDDPSMNDRDTLLEVLRGNLNEDK